MGDWDVDRQWSVYPLQDAEDLCPVYNAASLKSP